MAFKSIIFPEEYSIKRKELHEAPGYFKDLNLNQIVETITKKRDYLKPIFYTPLTNAKIIQYRHEVMSELESDTLLNRIKSFANSVSNSVLNVKSICEHLSQVDSYYFNYIQKGSLLEAAKTYCEEIKCLAHDLSSYSLKSRGLLEFQKYITEYIKLRHFISLQLETNSLKNKLASVRYCMLIKGNCIKIRKYDNEANYTIEIEKVFEKFNQNHIKENRKKQGIGPYAEHIEAKVLDMVAKLYPEIFSCLDEYTKENINFIDNIIANFAQEVQFYISYLEYIAKFKKIGLQFCYPKVSRESKEIYSYGGFDLALANKLIEQNIATVCNDFYLKGNERIIVVSGPNQGGKTTFARVFGQLHHLASLGCPVPGKEARLYLFDQIYTHFEVEEDIQTQNGKLQDELIRMYDILRNATGHSIIIINEVLSSTTLEDAVYIGKKIMMKVVNLDALCVCVTFIDELASLSAKNVSMVSTVVPDNPVRRTYKIIRSPANGLAYAIHIAEKHRVTYNYLKERIKS